ncbi:MAG: MazG family protein, partial [Myxococcota bacterium]
MFSLKSYWLKLRLFFPLRSWITVSYRVAQLHQLVRILRGPQGCPWDRKQTLNTMLPYVEEEVRELLHAFVHQDNEEVRDEFGDLLFVLFFLEHLFAQNQHFDLNQSIGSTLQKMVRRHPHVFRMQHTKDKEDIEEVWQKTKQQEREEKAKTKTETPEESKKTPQERALQEMRDIPPKCSALHQALHIGYATKKADFDWSNPQQVWNKVLEELDELKYAINHQTSKHQNAELGDLLFS